MKLPVLILALASAVSASAMAATPAPSSYDGHEMAGQAKVSLAAAESVALKARPGRIVDRELEKEAGGSGLRWSFDIKANGKTYEVGVDAADGKVLENAAEGAHPD